MYTTQLLAAALALAPSSLAVPSSAPVVAPLIADGSFLPKGGFTVRQVSNGPTIHNGAVEVQKMFRKFRKTVPAHIATAASSAKAAVASKAGTTITAIQNGSIVATSSDSYGSEYICMVQIGSTGQQVRLDFDTGSSDL